jgi:hypothetical protein
MLSWSAQKKFLYTSAVLVFLALVIGTPLYLKFFKKPPSCFDGVLNQDERHVDCGGVCVKICLDEVGKPIVLFERYFKVANGVYNAVAVIENDNKGFYALRIPYTMKFYDKDNVILAERAGETFMTSASTFPVIEYAVDTRQREVSKVTFTFSGDIDWKRGVFKDPKVEILNKKLYDDKGKPKISATFRNDEVYKLEKIAIVALVYGSGGNLIASSHTLVDEVAGESEVPLIFTWNEPFSETPEKIDLIPRLIPRELTR